ncbi:MAG: S-layer homology domain-containing protein [Syntrophomonas sp.]
MKKKLWPVILVLGLMLLVWPAGTIAASSDIENHWAQANIEALHAKGIINGDDQGLFRPNDPINRAEMATLVNRAFGFSNDAGPAFVDVKPDDWFAKAVSIAATQGYLQGVGNNRIDPEAEVSREQAAVILARVMNLTESGSNGSFKDSELISGWAQGMVGAVTQKGYMVGNNSFFRPAAPLTRGEAAAVIERILRSQAIPLNDAITRYDIAYLQSLPGGFVDTIARYAEEEGLTVAEFKALCEKAAADMSPDELAKMNNIRAKQMKPTPDTLMQKVITIYDMNKYLSGEYKTPKGFISICADVKQYKNLQDCYYGLRLDYNGTYFKPDEKSYAVIRFRAANIGKVTIPRSKINSGTFEDPYPFGGAGFTTGTNGRWGSPEWVMPEFTVLDDGAQIFELFQDGTEVLKAIYRAEAGQFVAVE